MADKGTELSLVIRTVDKATAGIRTVNKHLDEMTRPTREFGKALKELGAKSGFNDLVDGARGVGGAVKDLLGKVLAVGAGAVGIGVALKGLVDEFDDLGDKSERLGVTNDFLASMRFAAERSGASMEALDSGLQTFTENIGQARAGTGRMVKFLSTVSPALLSQLKATKSNEAAFRLLADAMAKVTDPAKRAALAQKTVGDAALAPLLARGSAGLLELQGEFANTAGSMEEAADGAGKVDDSLRNLKAATTGIKAALLKGLSPALQVIIDKLKEWLVDHRADVERWADDIGKKLPGAVEAIVNTVKNAAGDVADFVDAIGGWKVAAGVLAAVIAGSLVAAVVSFGAALLATPLGPIIIALAAAALGVASLKSEIDKLNDALDTTHELMLQDAAVLTPEQFKAKYPGVTSLQTDLTPAGRQIYRALNPDAPPPQDALVYSANNPARLATAQGLADLTELAAPAVPSEARIKVDFANAPRGTRVTAEPQNTAHVDMSVGYQLLPGGM